MERDILNNKVAAGIVLYNPENVARIEECLHSVIKQVEQVYIFDNSTKRTNLPLFEGVKYISENENKGIAYALNRIMECAEKDGFKWVLTMDQDSILPDGMVEDFSRYFLDNQNLKLGIICPQVIDKRRPYMTIDDNVETEYRDMCITSASCTSVQAWKDIGKFDEWLFIDLVDNEFCKRLLASGYKILQVKKWVLDQEFGKIIPKSKGKQQFWIKISKILHNRNFAKFSYKKFVSPVRVYYTCRNIIYVNRKMKKYGPTAYQNYNCKSYWGFLISFVVPSIIRADKKVEVCKAVCRGTYAGLKKKVEPWIAYTF